MILTSLKGILEFFQKIPMGENKSFGFLVSKMKKMALSIQKKPYNFVKPLLSGGE